MKYVLLAVLVGILFGGGVVWYKRQMDVGNRQSTTAGLKKDAVDKENKTDTKAESKSTATDISSTDLAKLWQSFPGKDASSDKLREFNAEVGKLAIASDSLDVSGCVPKPKVISLPLNAEFLLKNQDNSAKEIVHPQFKFVAEPASERKIVQQFSAPGVYGYNCDGQMVGIILVTSK